MQTLHPLSNMSGRPDADTAFSPSLRAQPGTVHDRGRRSLLAAGAVAAGATLALPLRALAQASSAAGGAASVLSPDVLAKRQAEMLQAHPDAVQNVITAFVDGRKPKAEGLLLDVAMLADNPSAVPVRVSVDPSLITESNWCEELIILAEKNPIPLACRMYFTPLAGVAEAAVRVRLARSQAIHALARMKDGQILEARKDVTVAASGCGM